MKIRVTIKLTGESKHDALVMPDLLKDAQAAMETNRQAGMWGPPEGVDIRFLVQPGKWE